MIRTATVSIEELLEHSAWVRALARQLVADGASADDLVQETWTAALVQPPARGVPLRPWLARVLRNAARMSVRGSERRTARERLAARSEALASAHDVVELAARQRDLVEALLALEEPQRTTLLLRYFHALPPRRIAARLEISVETVHTRLRRGLQRLRSVLEQRHGADKNAWLSALLPLARAPQFYGPSALGWITMNLKLPLAAGALLVLGAIAWMTFEPDDSTTPNTAVSGGVTAISDGIANIGRTPEPAPGQETPAPTNSRAPVSLPAPSTPKVIDEPPKPELPPLVGKLIDDLGRGLSGVTLVLEGSGKSTLDRTQSAAGGAFVFEGEARAGRVTVDDPSWCTVMRAVARAGRREVAPVVVAARKLSLGGRVVDELGLPLAGASVRAPMPDGFRSRFNEVLDLSEDVSAQTVTDADGRFVLDAVALLEGGRITASMEQFLGHDDALPTGSDQNLLIQLHRPLSSDGTVRGQVIDRLGVPVAAARVALGLAIQTADSEGNFLFLIDDPESMNARMGNPARTMTAASPGLLPATYEPPRVGNKPQWPAFVTMRLGENALEISGQVVDSSGGPLGGVSVFLSEAAILGGDRGGPIVLENYLAGAESGPSWRTTTSDAEGRFVIDGLLPQDYRVRAMDADTLLIAETELIAAGSVDVKIRLDTSRLHPRVAGRIVGRDGKPVAHASVGPMCDAFCMKHMGSTVGTSHGSLAGTTTDAEGRFELKNVPDSLVYLRIDGEDLVPLEYGRVTGLALLGGKAVSGLPRDRIEDLQITVGRRCHFQVELNDPEFADELEVRDDAFKQVALSVFVGNSRRENDRQPLKQGRSEVIACPDDGVMLVLLKGGVEVSRRRIELRPGEVLKLSF